MSTPPQFARSLANNVAIEATSVFGPLVWEIERMCKATQTRSRAACASRVARSIAAALLGLLPREANRPSKLGCAERIRRGMTRGVTACWRRA